MASLVFICLKLTLKVMVLAPFTTGSQGTLPLDIIFVSAGNDGQIR
jgi:hypothetical protein